MMKASPFASDTPRRLQRRGVGRFRSVADAQPFARSCVKPPTPTGETRWANQLAPAPPAIGGGFKP
jgi:hypothetical protein